MVRTVSLIVGTFQGQLGGFGKRTRGQPEGEPTPRAAIFFDEIPKWRARAGGIEHVWSFFAWQLGELQQFLPFYENSLLKPLIFRLQGLQRLFISQNLVLHAHIVQPEVALFGLNLFVHPLPVLKIIP